ncbi:tetratricopeptide repeat protein [Chitinophaga arvensicola]|uniref:TPR repeat-containing protein n=1 Tax=Chitinophaga arvensicola TaxID=29529 RepID=A0A1I0RQI3_9BACT|nr:tetratricopeptide repeat protein [Chitinophaga arvensicola]SEW42995.1 TPR repeat-containing protein [Chitinophaga arvensicola]
MNTKTFLLLGCLLATGVVAMAQTKAEQAREKTDEAIRLMDGGKPEASLPLLEEALKLTPDDPDIRYEQGFAYYLMKDYKEARNIMKKLLKADDPGAKAYQMLGNCYDLLEDSKKAIATYEDGLKRYPDAGNLYLERGIMELKAEQYTNALRVFEKGIEKAPMFSSNYYWASKLFCTGSDMKYWGMMYGEIFVNLERSTRRTEEISQLLFNTYKKQISFPADSAPQSNFTGVVHVNITYNTKSGPEALLELLKAANTKTNYGKDIYDPVMRKALVGEQAIDLASLNRVRCRFLEEYEAQGFQEKKPVVLFDFEREVKAAGHLEAYHYWVLGSGDKIAFNHWQLANNDKWEHFKEWIGDHPFRITEENKFNMEKY